MPLLNLDGIPVLEAVISLPRQGVPIARLALDATSLPAVKSTPSVLATADGGVLVTGYPVQDRLGVDAGGFLQVLMHGGAGKLPTLATPKWYAGGAIPGSLKVGIVLGDLLDAAGETLDSGVDQGLLQTALQGWTTWAQPIATMLDALVSTKLPDGTVWRITAAGKLWVGVDTWPKVQLPDATLEQDFPRERRAVLISPQPLVALVPGISIDLGVDPGLQYPNDDSMGISYVEHRIAADRVRSTVWLETI